jgi:hypothetical protein
MLCFSVILDHNSWKAINNHNNNGIKTNLSKLVLCNIMEEIINPIIIIIKYNEIIFNFKQLYIGIHNVKPIIIKIWIIKL